MAKTLGQVAFEAHMLSEDGLTLPGEWFAHDADEQKHWQAAAEAVADEVGGFDRYRLATALVGKWNQHRAVIEAAKLVADRPKPNWDALAKLQRAVEALEEVEAD